MSSFESSVKYLEDAAKELKVKKEHLEILRNPERVITVNFPVKMDNGGTKVFTAHRVQFNRLRGPAKGGIRYHPDVNLEEVKNLAFLMMMKNTIVGIPFGGGKGGMIIDVKAHSKGEVERATRAFVREIADFIGPQKDVPAPDVYTNPETMGWIMDEYSKIVGKKTPAVVTGKPIEMGGSKGRDKATGLGGTYVTDEAVKKFGIKGKVVAIQGFGNAGQHAAIELDALGYKIVAVSDSRGGIYKKDGFDIKKLLEHKNTKKDVSGFEGSEDITNTQLLELDVSILALAALEDQITKENAANVKAKIIVELANGPTTKEADEIIYSKKCHIIPDILANAGGVTVSYFEWLQNLENEQWEEKKVNKMLKEKMVDAFKNVVKTSEKYKCQLRRAAFIFALSELVKEIEKRGF